MVSLIEERRYISQRPRGRPRDPVAREAILNAAYELVLEHGYREVTTTQIAKRAGSGKQTLYRWWPTKGLLMLDALEHWTERFRNRPRRHTLSATLMTIFRGATLTGPLLRALMAEAQTDPELQRRLRIQIIEPRGASVRACLGDRRPHERDLIVDLVSGLFWQRLLLGEPLDAAFVRRVLNLVNRIG